jgi:putative oxidoreductase
MSLLHNHKVVLFVRWLLALVFLYAGIAKIINPADFAQDIDNYRILPYVLVTLMAAILPWIEVLCGLLLITGKWNLGAALTVSVLNFVFIVAISSALVRGLDISCGCFATFGEGAKAGFPKIFEDMLLLAGSLLIFYNAIKSDLSG